MSLEYSFSGISEVPRYIVSFMMDGRIFNSCGKKLFTLVNNQSSIVIETIETVFIIYFFYKRNFKHLKHK